MPINVENNLKVQEINPLGKIHFLPFKIEGDGEANVKKYFDPYIKNTEDGGLTASFRGYPLSGSKFPLPSGYSLTLATEGKTPLSGETERNFKVKCQASQDDVVYWNWDTRPSQNDPYQKSLKWIALAEALHKPISLEE